MKRVLLLFLFAVLLTACITKENSATEQQLFQMLHKKDLFRLETLLEEKRSELTEDVVLYFEAHLQNAFNQTTQSLQTIDTLLNKYGELLNDTLLYNVFAVKYDNHRKQNDYFKATEALKIAIDKYGYTTDSTELIKLKEEEYCFIEPLKEFPPQRTHITTDIIIPASLNQYNHIIVNVSTGKQSEKFIFDTGATNVISESSAQRLGVRVLESSAYNSGAADKKFQYRVGFADTLRIGDLLFENVAFKVMADELLSFPEADYVIHGIIGFSVINQMREVIIRKNESITVVANPTKRNVHNLFLSETMPLIQFEANNDTVLFIMDTGANTSKFSEKYFAKNNTEITNKAVKKTMRRVGVGGFVDSDVYELKDVQLKIGQQELTVPGISVLTDQFSYLKHYDGLLGQDVLMHFNNLIINFEDMYLIFKD